MDKILFGTGGWRAVIGEDFICKNIRRVAKGISLLMQEENKTDKPVIIGFDRRFLSENAAKWVAEVLTKDGIKVLFMDRSAPTPLVMHTVKDRNLDFGIEITASHNPSIYNGIKLIVEEGRDAPVETTARLEKLIEDIDEVEFTQFDVAVEKGLVGSLRSGGNSGRRVVRIQNHFRPRALYRDIRIDALPGSAETAERGTLQNLRSAVSGQEPQILFHYREGRSAASRVQETVGRLQESNQQTNGRE